MEDWFLKNERIEAKTLKRLQAIYADAAKKAVRNQKSFLKKVQDVATGKIKPPQYYIDTDQVDKWRQGFLIEAERRQHVVDGIIRDLNRAGKLAAGDIQDSMKDVYQNTYTGQAKSLSDEAITLNIETGDAFTQYNRRQIGVLLQKEQSPFSKIAYENMGRNTAIRQRLQSALAVSIINGESQEKMLRRIKDVTGQAYWQAKRVAQTERTRVQAQAAHDTAEQAHRMGIRTYKKWLCAMMPTSRESHIDLNGRCAYTEDPFETVWGNALQYPGDPHAPAKEVINCHCTYVEHVLLDNEEIIDGKLVTARGIYIRSNGNSKERPQTYAERNIEIPERLQKILTELKEPGDYTIGKNFSARDLQILSTESGTEYAVIKFKNSQYLIRGTEHGTFISEGILEEARRKKAIFAYHSHPYIGDLRPSDEDIMALKRFTWQTKSDIIDPTGNISSFTATGGAIEMKTAKNEDNAEELQEIYNRLFGEEKNDSK